MNELLRRLAEAQGILLAYHDIWGNRHEVSEGALRSLLAAMHVCAEDDGAIEAALRDLEAARWSAPLAPMSVLRTNARPWSLRVRMREAAGRADLAWRVISDAGDVQHHAIDGTRLDPAERTERGGESWVAFDIVVPFELPAGYYRVAVLADDESIADGLLAVAPPACYRPPSLSGGRRAWGAAVQLYGLKSARDWGIGDFGCLGELIGHWGAAGADIVGLNPLHVLFPHDPERASPYSPSSRLFVNPLYLDVASMPEFAASARARELVASASFGNEIAALRESALVQYGGVAAAKHRVLEIVYADARRARGAKGRERWARFESYKAAAGEALERQARFEALQEHFHRADPTIWGWPVWPEPYRDPASEEVKRFAGEHAERVDYFSWLQWQANLQRSDLAAKARDAGMTIGVYTDLAVSVDRSGAEAWARQDLYALDASVGAPPDSFNVKGQDWGLPPMIPARLVSSGFAEFIATLRANMRDTGALRIDHVMGLHRLFWIPRGSVAAEGAYVRYPLEALLGLIALESHRNRCVVIGEDLGTVTDEVRRALADNDILSYRVLLFERGDAGDFKPPQAYPEPALTTASTHDLPTLSGWWKGQDIALRARHGMLGAQPDIGSEIRQRADERRRLSAALVDAAVLAADRVPPGAEPTLDDAVALAAHRFLAKSRCALMVVQPEDVFGVEDQANLPGTTDEYPNWRRKLPVDVGAQAADARFIRLAEALRAERPHTPVPPAPAQRRDVRPHRSARRVKVPLPLDAIPRSTYRLQLHEEFTFRHVVALVPYFSALGISHLYCSPYLRARPGSRHGYDVVDHRAFNPEIGTREDFEQLVEALARHRMSHLCDVVPNHMAIFGGDNAWWMDVLEHGQASQYATHFDIDWDPPDASLRGKVLVPILGRPYGEVLDAGELRLAFEAESGTFAVRYYEHRLPLDPSTYPALLDPASEDAARLSGATARAWLAHADACRALPSRDDPDPDRARDRRRDAADLKARLVRLVRESAPFADVVVRAVERINGIPGQPSSFDALHALLEQQAWRLAYWRVAGDEINYRRFFDVNELAGLRMERDEVFDATHDFLLGLAAEGKIGGLRIDHPDGLADPARYFDRLQLRYRDHVSQRGLASSRPAGLYVVLEKIAAQHEPMPEDWPVHGDTGYPFANAVNAVLIDPTARSRIDRVWRSFVGDEAEEFEEVVYDGKRTALAGALAAGLTTLAGRALAVARANRGTRDFTYIILRRALEETVAWFPVYRTYVSPRGHSALDRHYIEWAVSRARRRSRIADASVFAFVRSLLLAEVPNGASEYERTRRLGFAIAFQQFTPPVAAKGIEDTSFYRYTRLVTLNEVGGHPASFGLTRRAFHRTVRERFLRWPSSLLATSTHDNKRSEDVRARIDVISERPAQWRLAVRRWRHLNRMSKREIDGKPAPSANDEYLLYQTLVGTFPVNAQEADALDEYRRRIEEYAVKAAREAKLRTSWIDVDVAYEAALRDFVGALLSPRPDNRFLDELRREVQPFAWFGMLNSLSMALLKFTIPGVPDVYQGNEMLDFSLVDPDNRRPIDFPERVAALARLQTLDGARGPGLAAGVRALFDDGIGSTAKLWLTLRALAFRNRHAAVVAEGDYVPLPARGAHARHVLAFARRHRTGTMVVAATRLTASLAIPPGHLPLGSAVWGDDTLDTGFLAEGAVLTNALTGESVPVAAGRLPLAAVLASFPGALLWTEAPA